MGVQFKVLANAFLTDGDLQRKNSGNAGTKNCMLPLPGDQYVVAIALFIGVAISKLWVGGGYRGSQVRTLRE